MAFAIFKLSYNEPGDSKLSGGICGTGFFVDPTTALTAHHVLNNDTFRPNPGFQHALLWIISRNGQIHCLERSYVELHPEIDTTVIRFEDPIRNVQIYDFATRGIVVGMLVRGIGHGGNVMPAVDAQWRGRELRITSVNLERTILDTDGHVKRLLTLHVNANDVKLQGVSGFELSFASQVGMSGGPVVDRDTGEVLGLLSLGLPPDSNVKTETFAVAKEEILKRLSLN
jgi:hypothetical protein